MKPLNTPALDSAQYQNLYRQSLQDPNGFWAEQAQRLFWFKPFSRVDDSCFANDKVDIRWFEDGKLNVSYNCLDRHLVERGESTALIWEGDDPSQSRTISYRELHGEVCRFANLLKAQGVQTGDVVTLYMPMIPEAAVAMLACSRIGAIHSVVFAGFSAEALAARIKDAGSRLVVTASCARRGGKTIALKDYVDKALQQAELAASVETVLVVQREEYPASLTAGRDLDYHQQLATVSADCQAVDMAAEAPLFILYTSGSTGTPKGLVHSTGGYLVYAAMSHQLAFDYRPGDIYWCTADIGWITGHSYLVYGPLANGATSLMFEGVPSYPDNSRFGQVIEKYRVNQFYTAPTAIRALMQQGDEVLADADLSSLRILGSVGEPINPEAWNWYQRVFGQGRCPVVDTWWQTETGGMMVLPLPGTVEAKPGAAMRPFFGVEPVLLDSQGQELPGAAQGSLAIKRSWPGQSRTIWKDHPRFMQTYFSNFKGYYTTGDGARRDAEGDLWITGRVDDVLNVSGHRMGTAEIESALVAHRAVAEAAVVGYPHCVKGQGIYVYVTLQQGYAASEQLLKELKLWVREEIGPIASPDLIQFTADMPKTRSGKIMRRILRKIAEDDFAALGDTSTLADPAVLDSLIDNRQNRT